MSAVRFLLEAEAEFLHEVAYYSGVRPGYGIPFSIVYRSTEAELLIVAIAADRRRPNYWLGRTGERRA